jgi:hypothetical protein
MAKPAFDPSKPYQAADQAQKPAFDPSKPFESVEENELDISEPPGLLKRIGTGVLQGAATAGKFVDSYTGAPTRAAVGAAIDGKNPFGAGWDQLGEDPSKAPTGKDIALKVGVSDEHRPGMTTAQQMEYDQKYAPNDFAIRSKNGFYKDQSPRFSNADLVGAAGDVGLDYTNLIPGAFILKTGMKATGEGLKGMGRVGAAGVGKIAELAAPTATKALQATEDVLTSSKLGSIAVDTAKTTKRQLESFFSPKQVENYADTESFLTRKGIDPTLVPESIKYGPGSSISRIARGVRENSMTGEQEMEKFIRFNDSLDAAMDDEVIKLGGGPVLEPVEAGQLVKQSYERSVDRLFNERAVMTYQNVVNSMPGIELTGAARARVDSKLAGIEKWAKGRMARGFTATDRTQGEQVLRAIEQVKNGNGSLKQTYETMLDIGRVAYRQSKQGLADVPPDIEKFRDLYDTLSQAFVDSTRYVGGHNMAKDLELTNKEISSFLKTKEPIAKLLDNGRLAPEKLFRHLVVAGDTKQLEALKQMVTPEEFNRLRAAYVGSLITRNSDDAVNAGALRSRLQKNTSTLSVLFSPDELKDLVELVKLKEKSGPAVLSTSGTGASNILRDTYEAFKSGVANKSTLNVLKDSADARARGLLPPAPLLPGAKSTALVPTGQLAPAAQAERLGFKRPSRGPLEEKAKLLQILGTMDQSKKKEDQKASERRMREIIEKRLAK